MFVEVIREKLVGEPFWHSPSWIGLKFIAHDKTIKKYCTENSINPLATLVCHLNFTQLTYEQVA